MQVRSAAHSGLFGLYELGGTARFFIRGAEVNAGLRVRRTRLSVETTFTGVAPFENIADLRRHFRRFLTDNRASDTVVFDCLFDTEIVRAKVFMTRAYEVDHDHASGIVVMDIRQLAE